MIVFTTIKGAGSLSVFSSITQGRNPKAVEMQTRDPLVHLDHQGYVAQKVNTYIYSAIDHFRYIKIQLDSEA